MGGRWFRGGLFRPAAVRDCLPRRRRWRMDLHMRPCPPSASTPASSLTPICARFFAVPRPSAHATNNYPPPPPYPPIHSPTTHLPHNHPSPPEPPPHPPSPPFLPQSSWPAMCPSLTVRSPGFLNSRVPLEGVAGYLVRWAAARGVQGFLCCRGLRSSSCDSNLQRHPEDLIKVCLIYWWWWPAAVLCCFVVIRVLCW